MNYVDAIFYINLESRFDRKDHFLKEILYLTQDESKIHRIDAVHNTNGAMGCALSHIKALEQFLENQTLNTCIIFEDDFTFTNKESDKNNTIIETLFREFPAFDCCCLAYNPGYVKYTDTHNVSIKKTSNAQTTSGYCITRAFALTLLNNLKKEYCDRPYRAPIDVYWKEFQADSNWYITYPALGYQYNNYSNIVNRDVAYNC